jgi:hypothetical protein
MRIREIISLLTLIVGTVVALFIFFIPFSAKTAYQPETGLICVSPKTIADHTQQHYHILAGGLGAYKLLDTGRIDPAVECYTQVDAKLFL